MTKALKEFIARREQKEMINLFGKLDWDAPLSLESDGESGSDRLPVEQ